MGGCRYIEDGGDLSWEWDGRPGRGSSQFAEAVAGGCGSKKIKKYNTVALLESRGSI